MISKPRKKTNDGHHYTTHSISPFSNALRNVASLVPNERPKTGYQRKYAAGIGMQHAAKRKFDADQVRELRRRYGRGVWPSVLAKECGVGVNSMKMLLHGITYAWVIDEVVPA